MGKTTLQAHKKSEKNGKSSVSSKIPSPAELKDAKIKLKKAAGDRAKTIHVYEVYFCDDGSVYGDKFKGEMIALHLEHEYPNVFFNFPRAVNAYCASRRSTDETFPGTTKEACEDLKMRITSTTPRSGKSNVEDEDKLGMFVKNRHAIYCERANLKKLCCFLDGFIAWRVCNQLEPNEPCRLQEAKINFHIQKDSVLNLGSKDKLKCEIHVIKDMDTTGVTAWQAYPPVWPPRFVLATMIFESANTISLVFKGNTYPFAAGFNALNIGRKANRVEGSTFKEWYHCVPKVDVSIAEKRDWLLSIFGKSVLKNSPCILNIPASPKADPNWKTFIQEISQFTNVIVRT